MRARRQGLARAIGLPIAALVLYFCLPFDDNWWPVAAAFGVIATLGVVPVAVRRALRIDQSDQPMVLAVETISLVVTMVAVGFAASYYAIASNTDQIPALHTRIDSLYFTVLTLGTVGYGDIAPVGQQARALVTLQIVLNLTLIGGTIRLIAAVGRQRREDKLR